MARLDRFGGLGQVLPDAAISDRRRLMIGADLIRAAAIGTMGVLSVAGSLEIWHIVGRRSPAGRS